jgi:hypothetical protein
MRWAARPPRSCPTTSKASNPAAASAAHHRRPWPACRRSRGRGREESAGEGLRGRLARELPDRVDDEVGDRWAGRLVEDDGEWDDEEPELHAEDVGIGTGAASAEEAAVHVAAERDDPSTA